MEWGHLDHGQWVIWSAASVVTGDAGAAHLKLRDRAVGAFLGVPAGIGLGLFLPHGPIAYGMAVVASLMTLVAFRSYLLGFATRCAAIAAALDRRPVDGYRCGTGHQCSDRRHRGGGIRAPTHTVARLFRPA